MHPSPAHRFERVLVLVLQRLHEAGHKVQLGVRMQLGQHRRHAGRQRRLQLAPCAPAREAKPAPWMVRASLARRARHALCSTQRNMELTHLLCSSSCLTLAGLKSSLPAPDDDADTAPREATLLARARSVTG